MKLVTFEVPTLLGPIRRIGLALLGLETTQGQAVYVDLNAVYAFYLAQVEHRPEHQRWADFLFPSDMRTFLELGQPALDVAKMVQDYIQAQLQAVSVTELKGARQERLVYKQAEVILKTPVPEPKMLRDFLSFEVHTANGFKRRNEPIPEAWYKMPVYYKGNPHTLLGPDEPVYWPSYTRIMDYELELACIIGKEGKNIAESEAGDYIAGYAIMNDFSARDIQKYEMQCRLGPAKGKDFGTAIGPWLVTKEEVLDPRNLRMTAKINGEIWSDGNSGTSHWTFEQMIAHVSKEETLYPGDILGSGTVGFGCGLELDRWLQPNDLVELEITGLGLLANRVLKP